MKLLTPLIKVDYFGMDFRDTKMEVK